MFLEIAEGGEEFHTSSLLAIKCVTAVQSLVSSQSVKSIECLLASSVIAFKWFDFCVYSNVNLKAVRREEGLAATWLFAFKPILACKTIHPNRLLVSLIV